MTLEERLQSLLDSLPHGWTEAQLLVTVPEPARADRAALILAPLSPGRAGATFRIAVGSGQAGPSRDSVARLLDRLDRESVDARLSLAGHSLEAAPVEGDGPAPPARTAAAPVLLAASWDELVERLPEDWSDLYAEVELASSDELDRAALLLGPVNPFLHAGLRPALRFRVARTFGYGGAPGMTRRCLGRLDEKHIAGRLRILRVMSKTAPVLTQGPVWRESGRAI